MLKNLVVVDYKEGGSGEFISSWLSAHYGHSLSLNTQVTPSYIQKWLNSHSLIYPDWHVNFVNYLTEFNKICDEHNIQNIAIPYHLYKYPEHVKIFKITNNARFVRINCSGYEQSIDVLFRHKVLERILTLNDLPEVKFIVQNWSQTDIRHIMSLLQQGRLSYQDLRIFSTVIREELTQLPSNDIEIQYRDFLVHETISYSAYCELCTQLQLTPNEQLFNSLVEHSLDTANILKLYHARTN
jgi:hypothetical protein